ncbi:MAG TPA: tetratricopeptide repeat protein, partial [Archangium sp.]|nr:tetratricopeptide repeat protein [Archangium sp.]
GSLELPQVVAGDALGLTLFVGGLHFYKKDDYPRALRLFRSASEKLRTDSRSAADLLHVMGLTEYLAGRTDKAADYLSRCESLATGDSDTWWGCRLMQVDAHLLASHLPRAQVLAEEALRRSRASERRGAEANTLKSLGDLALRVSELKEARGRYEEALPLFRALGDRLGEANTLSGLGDLADVAGHYDDADKWYQQARGSFELIGDRYSAARTDWRQGLSLARRGNVRRAREVLTRAHRTLIELGDGNGAAVVLNALGSLNAEGPPP